MPRVLAVDLGASSGRVVAVELRHDRLSLNELHRFETPHYRDAGIERWNLERLLDHVKDGIRAGGEAEAIGVDTWGVDFGLLDASGNLIADPIRYRDASHRIGFEELKNRLDPERHYRRVGIQPLPFNTAAQLLARKLREDPELAAASKIMMLPDLIGSMLVRDPVVGCEPTIGSTSEMLGLDGEWEGNVLNAAAVTPDLLPRVRKAGEQIGILESGIPVLSTASHDTASAVLAAPLLDGEPAAFISSGTWSIVGIELSEPKTSPEARRYGFGNERGHRGTFRFLKNVIGLWLIQQSQGDFGVEQCVEMARSVEHGGAKFDIHDPSLLNPPDMRAAIRALADRPLETDAELFRAIFESLASGYAEILAQIEAVTGISISRIQVVGGGSQNSLLNQLTADASGLPVHTGPVEATALGNAMAQFETLGALESARGMGRHLIRNSFPGQVFLPKTG